MRIALLTVVTPDIYEYSKLSSIINSNYCLKQGYDYLLVNSTIQDRHHSWYKVKAIERYIDYYDYIFVLDADAIVNNYSISIEDIISEQKADFIISEDIPNGGWINAGSFIVRNNPLCKNLLKSWWNKGKETNKEFTIYHEQDCLIYLLTTEYKHFLNNKVKVLPTNYINSACNLNIVPEDNFIIHYMAKSNEERKNLILQKIIDKNLVV